MNAVRRESAPPDSALRLKRPRLAGLIIGGVALAGLIALVLHLGDIAAFVDRVQDADPSWLAAGVAAQIAAFAVQAVVWALPLAKRHLSVHGVSLFNLAVGKLFADQAIPSVGLSGAVFLIHALSRRGVAAADAFATFIIGAASSIIAFLVFATGAVALIAAHGETPEGFSTNLTDLHYIAIIAVVLALTVVAFYIAASGGTVRSEAAAKARGVFKEAMSIIRRERVLFLKCVGLQAAARLLDCVTLFFVFLALGDAVSFLDCVIAVSLAALAATLAPTPMGLGSFEAGLIGALATLGVGVEAGLAAVLIYRGLSLGLPLTVGFFIVQRELLKK